MEIILELIAVFLLLFCGWFFIFTIRAERFGNYLERIIQDSHEIRMDFLDGILASKDADQLSLLSLYPAVDVNASYRKLRVSGIWDWKFKDMVVFVNDSKFEWPEGREPK